MNGLVDWLRGDLSTAGRIWSALAPALILVAYFVVGLLIYGVRCALRGPYRDQEMEARGSSVLVGMWIRLYFAWVSRPLWIALCRSGIPASSVTTLSFLLAVASGVSLGAGRFALGGWLYIFSGILDHMDGRLARATGTQSSGGAALDSVLDRCSDGVVLIGFAWFYRNSWVLLAVLTAMLGTFLVPYIRARGEGLGVKMTVGLMQRPERILYMGFAAAMSPILEAILVPGEPHPIHHLAVVGLVLLAASTHLTALRRFLHLLTALGRNPLGGWFHAGQGSLLRSQVAAGVATAADFLLVVALVTGAGIFPWFSTMIGCVLGAAVNFSVSRVWAFKNVDPLVPQASRYVFVSLTSALLNGGGVGVLLLLPALDYRIAWVLVRAVVALAWNYPLHRDYVFSAKPSSLNDRGARVSGSSE